MKISRIAALALVTLAHFGAASAAPVHVSVETMMGTQEHGAGISVGKGLECFVVTPAHVVHMGQTITITDRNGNTATATNFQEAPEEIDAILLKVEQDHRLDCPEDWDTGSDAEDILYDVDFLVSRKVKAGGLDSRRFFAGSVTSTEIELQPFSNGTSNLPVKGDSGSALYARNLLIGMITEVDTKTGNATAVKQSQLHALFAPYVLERTTKVVLINPVYQGYQENRYASAAVKKFVKTRTPLGVQEISSAVAQANMRSEQRGQPVQYPDTVDYVILSSILQNTTRRENNPNYDAKKAKSKNYGDKLLARMKGNDYRYFLVSNVDVEVTLVIPATNERTTHIEQLEYRTPLLDGVDQQEVTKSAPVQASVQAVYSAFNQFGLPVLEVQEQVAETGKKKKKKKKKNKKGKKKNKNKVAEDEVASVLGLSADD